MTRLLSHPTFKNMKYRANYMTAFTPPRARSFSRHVYRVNHLILSTNVIEQKLEDGNIFPECLVSKEAAWQSFVLLK